MTHPYDIPNPRCAECDAEITDLDGDFFACYYTGRACEPGCDCNRPTEPLCDDCECPAGGPHKWVTEWAIDYPGLSKDQRTHCDECGHSAPSTEHERDYPL